VDSASTVGEVRYQLSKALKLNYQRGRWALFEMMVATSYCTPASVRWHKWDMYRHNGRENSRHEHGIS
jgi:hypothetical protein